MLAARARSRTSSRVHVGVNALADRAGRIAAAHGEQLDQEVGERVQQHVRASGELALAPVRLPPSLVPVREGKGDDERVRFEWDPEKAAANLVKHGVSFDEAQSVFADQFATTVHDPDHSLQEDRWLTTGSTDRGQVLIVSHTNRGE
jgi:uncharacterized DUF497 family protein